MFIMIKVAVVDDNIYALRAIEEKLAAFSDIELVCEAQGGKEVIGFLEKNSNLDVILMDIEMPEMSGIQASEEIKRNFPHIKIIIVSMHNEKQLIKKLIDQGADGYLLKNSQQSEVMDAIEKVLKNQPYFSQDVTLSLLDKNQSKIGHSAEPMSELQLTDRETEILKLVSQGMTNKEIGDTLNISHRTVDTHRTNLMKKLDVTNVAGLIRFAFKNGLIQ